MFPKTKELLGSHGMPMTAVDLDHLVSYRKAAPTTKSVEGEEEGNCHHREAAKVFVT
jgi:hypothetical protein